VPPEKLRLWGVATTVMDDPTNSPVLFVATDPRGGRFEVSLAAPDGSIRLTMQSGGGVKLDVRLEATHALALAEALAKGRRLTRGPQCMLGIVGA
jgi:hypothetical protein